MVDEVLATFKEFLAKVQLQAPAIPFISNVSGTWITAAQATSPEYWARQLRETVRFRDGAEEVLKDPGSAFLEIGPGRTLSTLVKLQSGFTQDQVVLSSMRHPYDGMPDMHFALKTLGELWLAGARIDWEGFYSYEQRSRDTLPTYPFEHNRYWIDGGSELQAYEAGKKAAQISKKQDIADWFYVPAWRECVLSQQKEKSNNAAASPLVLLFVGDNDFSFLMRDRLMQAGYRVINIELGTGFKKLDDSTYAFDPSRHHEYTDLVDDVLASAGSPDMVVNLWNIGVQDGANYCDRGFYSILFLTQALAHSPIWNATGTAAAGSAAGRVRH